MKTKNTYKFLIILLLTLSKSWSQNEATSLLPNIVPPAPSAYQLGNYGNTPIGLVNGTSNINIPLLNFTTKNLSMPINLFYGSNGIKVDDVSSSVGLGWNMNAGGVITRSTNDIADEKDRSNPNDIPDDATLNDGTLTPVDINYFYAIGNDEKADSEKDIFSFNFNSISGKFVLDKNKNPIVIENQNVKIEKFINLGKMYFVITTNDGVQYYFTETEDTKFRSMNAGFSLPETYTTTWYLTNVKHPLGDEIYLEYEDNNYSFIASESQSLIVSNPYNQETCIQNGNVYQYGPLLTNITSHSMSINGKHIKKIFSNNITNGVLLFSYNEDNDPEVSLGGNKKVKEIQLINNVSEIIEKVNFHYSIFTNKRTFLNEIIFKDINKNYKFEYINPDQFPVRLSKSQDHWGYYNGKYNTTLVPAVPYIQDIQFVKANKEPDAFYAKIGMLKKIIYPTKGASEFEYEENTVLGQKTIKPSPIAGNLIVYIGPRTTDTDAIKVSEETIFLPFSQLIQLGGYGEFNLDACDSSLNTNHSQAYLTVKCIETNTLVNLLVKAQSGNLNSIGTSVILKENISFNTFYFDGQANMHYLISLKANYRCSTGGVNFAYYNTQPYNVIDNIVTGGIRVKSVKDIDENSHKNYKRFYYSSLNNLKRSSGVSSGSPFYISNSKKRISCIGSGQTSVNCVWVDVNNLVLSSSSIMSLYDKGSNVYYEYVTISYGDDDFLNGGENHQFIINRDVPGEVLSGTDFNNSSRTNSGWNNGLESKVIYFKNSTNGFLHLKESINTYVLDDRINKEVYSYPVRNNFQLVCFSFGQPDSIENLDIMRSVISSHWNYLSSNQTKEYSYDNSNVLSNTIVNETKYFYDNPVHAQLTSQIIKNSKGETIETKYYYAQDAEMANEPFKNELLAKNMIGIPLKQESFNGTNKLFEKKTQYGSFPSSVANQPNILPQYIYTKKGDVIPDQLEKKVTYQNYDAYGNITQYTIENGNPVSIIYGYNQTLPIAKIENITNAQLAAALGASNINSLNETNLPAINALRNNSSFINCMISTYTHIPLVGVSTITDSKGDTTTYTYDSFGRLEFVKDNKGNILSQNQYNYKH